MFPAIIEAWTNSSHKLPAGEIHWSVNSKIPPRQGLKSSSAICVAAIKALCEATDTELEDHQIVDIVHNKEKSQSHVGEIVIWILYDRS